MWNTGNQGLNEEGILDEGLELKVEGSRLKVNGNGCWQFNTSRMLHLLVE
jgi:hypothetical protein